MPQNRLWSHLRLNQQIASFEEEMKRVSSGFFGASLRNLKIRIKANDHVLYIPNLLMGGLEWLLCRCGDLGLDSRHPHKPDVAVCVCKWPSCGSMGGGEPQGSMWASLTPTVQTRALFKARLKPVAVLRPPHMRHHMYEPTHTHVGTHTHTDKKTW